VLLLDNSAWSELSYERVSSARRNEVSQWMIDGEIAVCLPFILEAGYSAQSAVKHREMMSDFGELPTVAISADVERLALQAQRELAAIGHHRLAPIDVMIAACAHKAEAGVLHYDGDYDILAEKTSLVFESEWLAPRGSL
jgi:predicted nucleic acid-binding protein